MVDRCDRRYVGKFESGALIGGNRTTGWRAWWGRGRGGEGRDQDGAERFKG